MIDAGLAGLKPLVQVISFSAIVAGCGGTPVVSTYEESIDSGYLVTEEELYLARVSESLIQEIDEGGLVIEDPDVRMLIDQTLTRLLPDVEIRNSVTVEVIRQPEVNAFATGNRHIYIHSGMFSVIETSGQFAALMAHEIVHLTEQHALKSLIHRKRVVSDAKIASFFTLGLSVLPALTALSNYSQEQETEADEMAIKMLVEGGYHPESMQQLLRNLQNIRGRSETNSGFWASHPSSDQRVEHLALEVSKYSVSPELVEQSQSDFLALRLKLIETNMQARLRTRQYHLVLEDLEILEEFTASFANSDAAFMRGEAFLGLAKFPDAAAEELSIIETGSSSKWRDYDDALEAAIPTNLGIAQEAFSTAYELDPTKLDSLLRMGEIELLREDRSAARAYYQSYVSMSEDPRDIAYGQRLMQRLLSEDETN